MRIDFKTVTGKIKPMHCVNNMPMIGAFAVDNMFHYAGEAGIPYCRLHDTGGAFGGTRYVDIPNIFRDFDADETKPESYDFTFTDWLIEGAFKQNCKVFYRLGVTIENFQAMKAYNIYPPKDFAKWARICEHIIAHYNQGWANGYHYDIEYWEIWNEPDNYPDIADNQMWKGTFEEYLELYKVTSLHLRKAFPNIKIGGYGSCGFYNNYKNNVAWIANSSDRTEYFIDCFIKFLAYVKKNNLPFDFFSWHSYSGVEMNLGYAEYAQKCLNEYGFDKVESILNEWNTGTSKRATLEDSANICEMMLKLQDSTVDMLMYYDGQVFGDYQGLYNPLTYTPLKAYYSFKAFNELYRLGNQAKVTELQGGFSAVAATSPDGNKKAVLITNTGDMGQFIFEADTEEAFDVYRLNGDKNLEICGECKNGQVVSAEKFETVLVISR